MSKTGTMTYVALVSHSKRLTILIISFKIN